MKKGNKKFKMNRVYFLTIFNCFLFNIHLLNSQTFNFKELLTFPGLQQESLSEILIKKGWNNHNFEMKSDSNFNKRIWIKENPYNNLKSYLIHYDYTTDTAENYIIYQFADRSAYKSYLAKCKELEFISVKSKSKKKSKKDKGDYKEIEEIYYSSYYNSTLIFKDVFFYGMNTFLVYSYRYKSAISKNILKKN